MNILENDLSKEGGPDQKWILKEDKSKQGDPQKACED